MASGTSGTGKGERSGRGKAAAKASPAQVSRAKASRAKTRPIKLKVKAKDKPRAAASPQRASKPKIKIKPRIKSQIKSQIKSKSRGRRVAVKTARLPKPKLRPDLENAAVTRLIHSEADLIEGVAALRAACQVMAKVHDLAGAPPLRRRQGGFEGLARIIVGQQLSVASAAAIWGRTEKLAQPFTPQALLALSDAQLASAGLSGPKIRTLRAIAQACVAGLDLDALETARDAHVHDALTAVNGIGPWTADIYLMFCLGRADAWAPGDLALQIAVQQAFGLKERPSKDELLEIAERWRPWRGVAARLLWAYYAVAKAQEKSGAIPV